MGNVPYGWNMRLECWQRAIGYDIVKLTAGWPVRWRMKEWPPSLMIQLSDS